MTKTLITGGAGFLGYHLAERLLKFAHEVHLVDNFSRGSQDQDLKRIVSTPHCHLHIYDLEDPQVCKILPTDYDYIYHFAAIVGVANVLNQPYKVLERNTALLFHVLSLAKRQHHLKRFIFSSTSEVYAGTLLTSSLPFPTPENILLTIPPLPHSRTTYMLSKIYGEALCHHSQVPFTIIRPHNIYGPRMGMSHVIPELLNKVHSTTTDTLEVASVDHQRTFCFIHDAIEFIQRVAKSPKCLGETLNIGRETPEISIGDLAKHIAQVCGKNIAIISKPSISGSPCRRQPDMSKTISLTQYIPSTELTKGLELTYQWYKKKW